MTALSARELEVARLIAEDLSDKIIADILSISPRTVQEYLERIAKKLRTGSSPDRRREAIRNYVRTDDVLREHQDDDFAAIWQKYARGRPMPQDPQKWLYVIRRRDTHEVKIGTAIDPIARLKVLQTAHGADLELVATAPANAFTEPEAHARFAEYRKKREWFYEAPAITRWINTLKKAG